LAAGRRLAASERSFHWSAHRYGNPVSDVASEAPASEVQLLRRAEFHAGRVMQSSSVGAGGRELYEPTASRSPILASVRASFLFLRSFWPLAILAISQKKEQMTNKAGHT
jgi:hypothetical protein